MVWINLENPVELVGTHEERMILVRCVEIMEMEDHARLKVFDGLAMETERMIHGKLVREISGEKERRSMRERFFEKLDRFISDKFGDLLQTNIPPKPASNNLGTPEVGHLAPDSLLTSARRLHSESVQVEEAEIVPNPRILSHDNDYRVMVDDDVFDSGVGDFDDEVELSTRKQVPEQKQNKIAVPPAQTTPSHTASPSPSATPQMSHMSGNNSPRSVLSLSQNAPPENDSPVKQRRDNKKAEEKRISDLLDMMKDVATDLEVVQLQVLKCFPSNYLLFEFYKLRYQQFLRTTFAHDVSDYSRLSKKSLLQCVQWIQWYDQMMFNIGRREKNPFASFTEDLMREYIQMTRSRLVRIVENILVQEEAAIPESDLYVSLCYTHVFSYCVDCFSSSYIL